MNVDRWRQVTEIFHAALARDAAARDAFLREAAMVSRWAMDLLLERHSSPPVPDIT